MSAIKAIQKEKVPGWGADLDFESRPAGRRETNQESVTNAGSDYDRIPRQEPRVEILVSTEHKKLTPIFGTSCPPKGLSGVIRRAAFRFSEGQKAHWLLLLAADKVNVVEGAVQGILEGKPDRPIREMGLRTEFSRRGFPARFGRNRADTRRWGQQAMILAPLLGAGVLVLQLARRRLRAS